MTRAVGKTGVGPTVSVAIEQHFPPEQRILDDDLAYSILPVSMRLLVRMTGLAVIRDWFIRSLEKPAPGIWSGLMVRKRYIDQLLVEAVGDIDAVVNLGAGFDTRLYRLPALTAVPAWEVDQPDNIRAKQGALLVPRVAGAPDPSVVLAPARGILATCGTRPPDAQLEPTSTASGLQPWDGATSEPSVGIAGSTLPVGR